MPLKRRGLALPKTAFRYAALPTSTIKISLSGQLKKFSQDIYNNSTQAKQYRLQKERLNLIMFDKCEEV